MFGAPLPLCMRDALAGEHGSARKEPLASCHRVLEVVKELELSFPQLEERTIGSIRGQWSTERPLSDPAPGHSRAADTGR